MVLEEEDTQSIFPTLGFGVGRSRLTIILAFRTLSPECPVSHVSPSCGTFPQKRRLVITVNNEVSIAWKCHGEKLSWRAWCSSGFYPLGGVVASFSLYLFFP